MNHLLIQGVYDSQTLSTLKDHGIKEFSFDMRGKSPNLITFRDLQALLKTLTTEQLFLTFENDRKETILSFLNLLQHWPFKFCLIFRDSQTASYYKEIGQSFYWMYTPESSWKEILQLENCKGVFLPLKHQAQYQMLPELWSLIEQKHLEIYLHAETFEETTFISQTKDIKLSIDLTAEVEKSFRTVDQEKLSKMKIWRKLNENLSRQR